MPVPAASKPIARPKQKPSAFRFRPTKGLAVAIFLLIVGIGIPLVVLPLVRSYRNGGPYDVRSRIVQWDGLKENLRTLESARAAFDKLGKEFEQKLQLALPIDADQPGLLVTIDGLAKNSGMQLTAIDISPRRDPLAGIPGVFPVDMGVTVAGGDYSRLKAFLRAIENNLRLMDVTGLAFSPRAASYAISIRTYMRAQR